MSSGRTAHRLNAPGEHAHEQCRPDGQRDAQCRAVARPDGPTGEQPRHRPDPAGAAQAHRAQPGGNGGRHAGGHLRDDLRRHPGHHGAGGHRAGVPHDHADADAVGGRHGRRRILRNQPCARRRRRCARGSTGVARGGDRRGGRAVLQCRLCSLRCADPARPGWLRRRFAGGSWLRRRRAHGRHPHLAAQHLRLHRTRHRQHAGAVAGAARRFWHANLIGRRVGARHRADPAPWPPRCGGRHGHRLCGRHAVPAVVPVRRARPADLAVQGGRAGARHVLRHPQGRCRVVHRAVPSRAHGSDPDPAGCRSGHRGAGRLRHRRTAGVPAGADRVRHRRRQRAHGRHGDRRARRGAGAARCLDGGGRGVCDAGRDRAHGVARARPVVQPVHRRSRRPRRSQPLPALGRTRLRLRRARLEPLLRLAGVGQSGGAGACRHDAPARSRAGGLGADGLRRTRVEPVCAGCRIHAGVRARRRRRRLPDALEAPRPA